MNAWQFLISLFIDWRFLIVYNSVYQKQYIQEWYAVLSTVSKYISTCLLLIALLHIQARTSKSLQRHN
jgi:hypothetical protein